MADTEQPSVRKLVRRAARGERTAWEGLIDRYGERIFNVALQFSSDRAQAEDLTQEIFLRLYRNLPKYRGDVPFVAWTLRLSRNLCIDHYRRARREREAIFLPESALDSLPSSADPRRDAERREILVQVREALNEMGEELAMAIVLRDLQGLSYAEVAALLQLPIGTLKSRLSRGRRQLIARLRERHDRAAAYAVEKKLEVAPC